MGVGAAPRALIISTQTGDSGTRILSPAMSSGFTTSFVEKVKSRQPQYQILLTIAMLCLSASSWNRGSNAGPRMIVSASFQSFQRQGPLAISRPGTSDEGTAIDGAHMS